ncbi:MAG: PEP-CTERM sorting domain-containing protein [Thiotrichales bacterium]|nr:PEP-CTERM sorting domain-containing protein [Thiotrichales bacterium]
MISVLLPISAQAAIKLKLTGTGNPGDGYGYQGLYLGKNFSESVTDPDNNWSWTDFDMTISENGDATIQGVGINNGNKWTGNGTNVQGSWNISIALSDIEFKDPYGNYRDGGNWNGTVNKNMISKLFAGQNPFGNSNGNNNGNNNNWGDDDDDDWGDDDDDDWGDDDDSGDDDDWSNNSYGGSWGFEWKSLSMTIDDIDENTYLDNNTWDGYAMPQIGHLFVAELHYNNGNVRYDAWYKNRDCFDYNSCSHVDKKFKVGDSKAYATHTMGVPEPGSLILLSLGLAGVSFRRLKL